MVPSVVRFSRFVLLFSLIGLAGCSAMMSSATGRFADSLSNGILNQNDPQIVADGAPAYLLLIDGLIDENPDDASLLTAGAKLYGAYASVFVKDPKRSLLMTEKALQYSTRAMCQKLKTVCAQRGKPFDVYAKSLATIDREHLPLVYTFSVSWAGWIQARADDWSAIGSLPKVKASLERVVALDPEFDRGGAQLYLGVMSTLLPPALGGKPEQARRYFETALKISEGRNLMAKVLFAERYARLVFDRVLHDRLLTEVISAEARAPGYTLSNTLAKERARILLAGSEEYF